MQTFLIFALVTFSYVQADKLLVTTGYANNAGWLQSSEVIDLINDDSVSCNDLQDYPKAIDGASGAMVNGQILICGGSQRDHQHMDACYVLGQNEVAATLDKARLNPAR